MPVQNDYILRLIELAGDMLRRAMAKNRSGEAAEALDLLDQAVRHLANTSPELLSRLTPDGLVTFLGAGGAPDPATAVTLATALEGKAAAFELLGRQGESRLHRDQAAALRAATSGARMPESSRPGIVRDAWGEASKEDPVAYFEWDPCLETGDKMIDEQHRSLFALANGLHEAVLAPERDPETVTDAIYRLSDYVVQHFADEEALMAAAGYPDVGVHRSLHDHLAGEVLKFTADWVNGADVDIETLAPFLTSWLQEHIRGEDKRFVEFAGGCRPR
jgi:hemerythrin